MFTLMAILAIVLHWPPQPQGDPGRPSGMIRATARCSPVPAPPARVPLPFAPFCQKLHPAGVLDQSGITLNSGQLPYVFVYIKSGIQETYPVPQEPAQLEQNRCIYAPHILGVRTGQAIRVLNRDDVTHSLHLSNRPNNDQPLPQTRGKTRTLKFDKPEIMVKVTCAVHPWMVAYIGVLDHPFFAITGTGPAEIKNIPDGEYEVEAWHEKWGRQRTTVTIRNGETKDIEFDFSTRPGKPAPAKPAGPNARNAAPAPQADSPD